MLYNSNVVERLNLYYQPEAFEKAEGIMYPLIVRLNNSDNIKEKLKQLSRDNFYTSEEPVVKIDTTIGDKILNLISIVCL